MNTEYITVTLAYIKQNGKRHHHSLFVFPKYYTFRMKQSDYKEVQAVPEKETIPTWSNCSQGSEDPKCNEQAER